MSEPAPPVGAGVNAPHALNDRQGAVPTRAAQTGATSRARAEAAAVEFEAAMLTSFIEPMLPDQDSPVWGGTGSSAWRGLFAQEIAAEIARAGGVGLAELVRPSLIEQSAPAATDSHE